MKHICAFSCELLKILQQELKHVKNIIKEMESIAGIMQHNCTPEDLQQTRTDAKVRTQARKQAKTDK